MPRPAFKVRLRLLSHDEGGRQSSIRSDYRPTFDVGSTWRGEPALNDGRILLGDGQVVPGEEAEATLEPLRPEYWDHIRDRMTLPVMEGARIVGHVTIMERVWPAHFTSSVAAFVRAAYEFSEFVRKAETASLAERLRSARHLLLPLYAAASELPDVEKVTDRQAPTYPIPEAWPGFGEHDAYWEVLDPYEHAEPVGGSLSDDLLDVYRDVRRGMWFWDKDETADAVWEWRFSFESHWGDHAVDALRALHRACGRTAR